MSADEKNKTLSTESIKADVDEKPLLDSVDAGVENKKPERVKPDSKTCLIERGIFGKVMWYSPYKGFGFLSRDDGQPDVFVHSSAIVRINRYVRVLAEGEEVEFDVVRGHKGPEAAAVTGKNGKVIHAYAYRVGQSVRLAGIHRSYRGRRNEANGVSGKTEDKEKAEDSTSTDESEGDSTETTSSSSEEAQQKKGNGDVKQQQPLEKPQNGKNAKPQNGKDAKPQAPAKPKEKQPSPQETKELKVETQKAAPEPKGKQPTQKQQDSKTEKPKVVQKQPEQKTTAGKAAK